MILARKDKFLKATALVTAVIMLSKVCGLARDIITAGYFGTGVENDAYASAYSLFYLPVLLFNSCITATMVPLYVEERQKMGDTHSNQFASNALNLFSIAALIIAALMFLFVRPLVSLLFHFDAAGIELTVKLTRIMMLGLVFNVASIVLASLLNAMEKFIAAQLTGFPLSFAVIIAAVGFSPKYGIAAIAWGVFAASVLQVVVLIPAMMGWFTYEPRIDLYDKRFHLLLHLAVPAVLSMGISEINHMIDRSLASGLATGSISAMNYAYKLITFLLGILMVPLTTVMFSRMSRLAANDDRHGVRDVLKQSIVTILLVTLPILAVAMVMAVDVVKMIFMRGSFTIDSAYLTGNVLLFYLVGLPAFGLRDLLNRTFHSVQDTKTPFRVACLVVGLNVALNLILRKFMQARGLALATSIASYIGMIVMFIRLRRRLGGLGMKAILPDLIKLLIAAGAAAAMCAFMGRVLPDSMTTLGVFARLVAATTASFIVYFAACILLRVRCLRSTIAALRGRTRR